MTEQLPVLFRAERSGQFKGDVTAVFPSLPGSDAYTATCYAHIGQHSACSRDWYWRTRAVRPSEYAEILAELREIYESGDDAAQLTVVHRWTKHHDAERRRACAA